MPYIQIQENALHFRLRRSPRVKRLQMILRQDLFEVVAPPRASNKEVLSFIWQHQRWMIKQSKRLPKAISPIFGWPADFVSGEWVPFRNVRLRLNVKFDLRSMTQLQQSTLQVVLPWQETVCAEMEKSVKQQVITWYQQQAIEIIQQTIAHLCPQLGRWPRGFQLKQQKTRWGSCGINEKIYLNWLLILAPPGVLEYVVAHELCHLFHRNHGKRFWAKVAQCMPDYEQHDRWLTKNGHVLHTVK